MSNDELELRIAWQRHVGRTPVADRWFESVLARHRAADRHYHGLRHVCWVVRHAGSLAGQADDPGAVIAAGFFHDAVYDPTRHDNETASAHLATTALAEIGWEPERIDHVAELIVATADHRGADRDTAVLLAADLAVLAADAARYGDYVRAVRREYAHVTEAEWRTGRAALLRRLLDRDHLFDPGLGLEGWEQQARANLTSELASLTA